MPYSVNPIQSLNYKQWGVYDGQRNASPAVVVLNTREEAYAVARAMNSEEDKWRTHRSGYEIAHEVISAVLTEGEIPSRCTATYVELSNVLWLMDEGVELDTKVSPVKLVGLAEDY